MANAVSQTHTNTHIRRKETEQTFKRMNENVEGKKNSLMIICGKT